MKILIDTNVLISTALFPKSVAATAFDIVIKNPSELIICDYELDEMRTVFNRKFPSRLSALDSFIANLVGSVNIVKVPEGTSKYDIRDVNDEPILRTAIYYDVDLILTGDKDFGAVAMDKPEVVTPREFLEKSLGK